MNNGKRITAFFLILLCLIFISSGLFYRAAKKNAGPFAASQKCGLYGPRKGAAGEH